jgi:predicted O-methyltransferase YrrM
MNPVIDYLRYRIVSKGRHGIHSPFVYEFVDTCLTTKMDKNFQSNLKTLKSSLKKDHRLIEITDFGAGSKKMSSVRKVSEFVRISSSKGGYQTLLYQLSKYYQPKNILELGTNIGMGTLALAGGNPDATVYTVDGCSETQAIAIENAQKMGLKNVHFIHQQFDDYLADLKQNPAMKFDVVFIDGNHRGEALKRYVYEIQPFIHEQTFLICDDIRWSNDMFDAWKSLENDASFHVSLDCFKFGILLKRSEQVKEQFVVKIPNSISGFI